MKISLSNLFNYFSVSGDSKEIKNFPQKSGTLTTTRGGGALCGGHHPKVQLFLTSPLMLWGPYVANVCVKKETEAVKKFIL